MGNEREWYRSTDWSKKDQEFFEKKLSRARDYNRAQYLRVKAIHLFDTKSRKKREAAYQLLQRVIQEYPDKWMEVNGAHDIMASEYWADRKLDKAEFHLRECIKACLERDSTSGTSGTAWLSLAMLIIETKQEDKYFEAKDLLDSLEDIRRLFRNKQFDYYVARARLASILGENDEAAENAAIAVHLSQIDKPQFSRHPNLGKVKVPRKAFNELVKIANRGALKLD